MTVPKCASYRIVSMPSATTLSRSAGPARLIRSPGADGTAWPSRPAVRAAMMASGISP